MIDVDQLAAETFIRQAHWHEELASTNSRALELAADTTLALPLLVGATRQTAGRGRGSNTWWAGSGTLTVSVLLNTTELGLPQAEWPRFSLGTALAVAETIEAFLPRNAVGLKWPNDVWLENRKVCGILIEQPERIPGRLVVGIGLNINTRFDDAPADIRDSATSFFTESGQQFNPADVLFALLQRWEMTIAAQRGGDWNLPRLWSRLCVLRDRRVHVTTPNGEWTGRCRGITDDGALLVEDAGRTVRCYAGTVRPVEPGRVEHSPKPPNMKEELPET